MKKELTDSEIFDALGDDGDNMLSEFKLADARIIEALVRRKTHIVWIQNTGKRPECSRVLVCLSDGTFDIGEPCLYGWVLLFKNPVKQYAIIEE